jgi:NAD(P)-dependent dehydrogenase (short-subunit alcohol dehydrogenase family)
MRKNTVLITGSGRGIGAATANSTGNFLDLSGGV